MKKPEIEFINSFSPRHGSISQWHIPFKQGQRLAICFQCGLQSLSDERLPFFKTKPDKAADEFYCGCYGFD